jgi:hypothetical protein
LLHDEGAEDDEEATLPPEEGLLEVAADDKEDGEEAREPPTDAAGAAGAAASPARPERVWRTPVVLEDMVGAATTLTTFKGNNVRNTNKSCQFRDETCLTRVPAKSLARELLPTLGS